MTDNITPLEVLAAHQLEPLDGWCSCDKWEYSVADESTDPSLYELHAAHVLDALTNAGWMTWPAPYVHYLARTVATVEEWATLRIQDWGESAAQDVLDIINEEGEWKPPAAAAAEAGETA